MGGVDTMMETHKTKTYRGRPACAGSGEPKESYRYPDPRTPAEVEAMPWFPFQPEGIESTRCGTCKRTDLGRMTHDRTLASTHLAR